MARLCCDVLIVGGGIAGSAAACALRDRGYRIVHVESSSRPLDTARGDHLQCVVVDILERWGALAALWTAGAEKRHAARYVTDQGAPILEIEYGTLPIRHPYYLYLHHERLASTFLGLAAANPDYVFLGGVRARDFDVGPEGVRTLAVRLPEERAVPAGLSPGERLLIEPQLVIGADGRGSRVREVLGFAAERHRYVHPLVVLLGPRLARDPDPRNRLTTFVGARGSISCIPRAFGGWKVGTMIRREDIGFWRTASAAERRAAIGALAGELEALELEVADFYPIELVNTQRWVRGNTVLLGDACHAMHPARGQGMNVAIRTLAALVERLPEAEALRAPGAAAACLAAYEAEVKPVFDPILAENHAIGAARDRFAAERAREMIDTLRSIQDDPQRLALYTLAAAGYGAGTQRSIVASVRSV